MEFGSGYATDTGQVVYPAYGGSVGVRSYPMQSYNNLEFRKANRRPSQSDVDLTPYPIRLLTNMSVTDVQLNNGLHRGVASGLRIPYRGSGYLYGVRPEIPGQTRDNAAGFHRRGPSPYNVQDLFDNGPGSQPDHPGGPGKIAATRFVNPMSG
jgi:hypothetical protein